MMDKKQKEGVKMLKVISSKEAVERLNAAGFKTNVSRLNAGLRQGVYPFGCAIKLNDYVYEIYSTLLDKWIAERNDRSQEEGDQDVKR